MQNEAGEYVDLYVPRKCSVTNRVITAKDHASVQINVGEIDETGRFTGNFKTYALCGFLRHLGRPSKSNFPKICKDMIFVNGEADDSLTRLCLKDGMVNKNYHS